VIWFLFFSAWDLSEILCILLYLSFMGYDFDDRACSHTKGVVADMPAASVCRLWSEFKDLPSAVNLNQYGIRSRGFESRDYQLRKLCSPGSMHTCQARRTAGQSADLRFLFSRDEC
jgi:hypothetical protein